MRRIGETVCLPRHHLPSASAGGTTSEVETAIIEFLEAKQAENLSPKSLTIYRHNLRLFGDYLRQEGVAKLLEISRRHISAFHLWLNSQLCFGEHSPSAYTVHQAARVVRTFLRWLASDEDGSRVKESLALRYPMPRVEEKFVDYFTREEFDAIMRQAEKGKNSARDRALLCVLADTGIRVGELCRLQVSDCTPDGTVRIVHGKGRRVRVVYLTPQTLRLVNRYLATRTDDLPHLFLTERGAPMTVGAVQQCVDEWGKRAHITRVRCSPHTIRHYFAVEWLRAGGSVVQLQKLLGHTKITTTMMYAKIVDEDLRQAHLEHSPARLVRMEEAVSMRRPAAGRRIR
jgi:integrase/recombinase XerD